MIFLKLLALLIGGFFSVVFLAITIRLYKMPHFEYNRLRTKINKPILKIKNNFWVLSK